MKKNIPSSKELYTDIEHSILSVFLGNHEINTQDLTNPYDFVDLEDTGGITPQTSCYGEKEKYCLSSAVARIALHSIQNTLPQFRYISHEEILEIRKISWQRNSKLHLRPKHLLEINWATSGPGFPWPESYHLCFIPIYNRYIVTASSDCPDVYGYTDIVIDSFLAEQADSQKLAKSIIKKWWSKQAAQSQERFEEVYAEGVFSADEAEDWADEIWGESDTEDWSPIELELAESSGLPLKEIREWLECN